jgi:hypothetical protein
MKKKTGIIAILVAILLLGVGYAAISNITLNVNSSSATVSPNQSNFIVKYDVVGNFTYTGNPAGSSVTLDRTSDTAATFTITGLTKQGDSVTITYPIINESPTLAAKLAVPTVTNDNPTYFSVTPVSPASETTLTSNGGTTNMELQVEVIKTPTSTVQTAHITAAIVASPVE